MAEADLLQLRFVAAGAKVRIESSRVRVLSAAEIGIKEGKASYDVILAEMGLSKIAVIKEFRDAVPGTGLAQAKALVESAPKPIKLGATRAEAEAIRQTFEAAGAKVLIK